MYRALLAEADAKRVPVLQRFFRTAPGEYADGDRFIGVRVPAVRALCRQFTGASLADIDKLLHSPIHEARLLALLLMVQAFRTAREQEQRRIYNLYLSRSAFINNWDLVDASAPHILGAWLDGRSRAPLRKLARSESIWERRMAMLATLHFMRRGDLADTFGLADRLLDDSHDLIHKAVGWMLRVAADCNPAEARRFLATRHTRMPRTMLRYAIEKFPEAERRKYLKRPQSPRAR